MNPKEAEQSFEVALTRLEALVEKLEDGTISLDESVAAYVEGTRLVRHCLACLERAETVIRELTETTEGFQLRRSSLATASGESEEDDDEEEGNGSGS